MKSNSNLNKNTQFVVHPSSTGVSEISPGGEFHPGSRTVWADVKILMRSLSGSPRARWIYSLALTLIAVLILNVMGEILLNRWQGGFFRSVERKNLTQIWHASGIFVVLTIGLLALVVSQFFLQERLKIRFRHWLTHCLLDTWFEPGLAYRLGLSVVTAESLRPDQRMQDDVKNLTDISGELGIGMLGSMIRFLSFIGVLWGLSSGVVFHFAGFVKVIPGYMVWVAIGYAALGSLLAGRVGRPLISLNSKRYAREADFRSSIGRVDENSECIAFYRGEDDEKQKVKRNFESVLVILRSMSWANARLTWVATGHGYAALILPVLVSLPALLQGKLDFGGLMMVIGAFNQVQNSLRWFVDNYYRIAEWRAVLGRVVSFHETLEKKKAQIESRIELASHPEGSLSMKGTGVALENGGVLIKETDFKVALGERILLTGESGAGKSTLLRVLGGLWPWGSGSILMPPKADMMFLPQKPFIPIGTLAAAVAYPEKPEKFSLATIKTCLERVHLEEFVPDVEKNMRWDLKMSLGQQQRLAFARLLLHKPKWVFLDEATSALDDKNQTRVMSIFHEELKGSSLISVGHRANLEVFHNRFLYLAKTRFGAVLSTRLRPRDKPPLAGGFEQLMPIA